VLATSAAQPLGWTIKQTKEREESALGAVWMAFRAKCRHRWRSWLVLAFLIAVVGGSVLTAMAAGRRTEAAFPQFVAAHGFDTEAYATQPVPQLAKLPGVVSATELVIPPVGQPTCHCTRPINPTDFSVHVSPLKGRLPFKLLAGRLPDPSAPDEVLASFTLQQDYGVHLGSVIHVPLYASSQASALDGATGAPPKPKGPTADLHVVGVEATEFEFPSGVTPSYDLYATSAFAHSVLPRTPEFYVYLVKLQDGEAGLSDFNVAANSLRAAGLQGAQSQDAAAAAVAASIRPQAIGWWILAALAALVGLAVVAQALARQSVVESEDYPTMAALGASRRQLVALSMATNVAVALVGAAGALGVATVLSPVAPLGEARMAESSSGIAFDVEVLLLGALAIVAVVVFLGLWPAWRTANALRSDERRARSGPSAVVARFAAIGAPPSAVIGVRNALERRADRATVPVWSALFGTVLAVTALCGTAVFGASLSHLTATPRLYGDMFDLNIGAPSGGKQDPVLLRSLEHDKAVTGITDGIATEISVNHVAVGALAGSAIRGPFLLSTVTGRLPVADNQIGLGETTMRQVGAHVGSLVHVTVSSPAGGKRTATFHVVSQVSFPVLGGSVSLGSGAVLTTAGYEDTACPPGSARTRSTPAACVEAALAATNNGGTLVQVVPGPRGEAAIRHYFDEYRSNASLPITPISLVNFGEAVNFPLIFGAMLAVVGVATLAHLLVVSVARRRREIGLLKVLGFVNRQVGSAVAWQATTVAVIGVVIGIPLGVAAGQATWRAFADNLGVVPVAVVPIWLVGGLAAGVIVVANLLAVGPALVATRSKPAKLLRPPHQNPV
jgi:hypothetical protein